MKYLLMIATAAFIVLSNVSASHAVAREYKACHAGNVAACKRWRDRSCLDDANPAACAYEEAKKQKDPFEWCSQRYLQDTGNEGAGAYRWCVNGSPDR